MSSQELGELVRPSELSSLSFGSLCCGMLPIVAFGKRFLTILKELWGICL
jgi:hypothetical protein